MRRWPARPQGPRTRVAAMPGVRAGVGGWSQDWARRAFDWLAARFAEEAEAGRPALWLPVAFGVGAAVYFAAPNEPLLAAACAPAFLASIAFVLARHRHLIAWLTLATAFACGGFLAGKLATERVGAPVLERPLKAEAVGRIVSVEPRPRAARRIVIALESLGALPADRRPAKVRVTLNAKQPLSAGDRISLTAFWRAPEGPVRPGGYDFARVAFFEGVGATGWAPSQLKVLPPTPGLGAGARLSAALERLRAYLTARIAATVGGPEGTVAAALVTGVQGPIPQDVQDDLRGAGLSHILSISGIHMALVAGTIFWFVRALLALSSRAALALPVKQIAAAAALAGATFYLALSGAEVATQRSYVMIAISLGAVLVGRPALAPRNFALAALIVMAWTPEAMLGPSFQMSFAAVAGLVAWFETRRDRERVPRRETRAARAFHGAAHAVTLAVMTTLIAGLATAPFAAYHFQRVTPYSLAGNALSEPLIGLIVMPAVVGGLLFAPLGLDAIWWQAMGFGLRGVLAIAHAVASWPGAQRFVVAFGETSLALFALGIAWLCLWRTALRWLALPILGAALLLAAYPSRPDVMVDRAGRSIAVRGPDGELAVVGAKSGGFEEKVWLAADGMDPQAQRASNGARCDALGCVAPLDGGGIVALVSDPRAFDEDCRQATLIVTKLNAPEGCAATTAVVDREILARTGALSLFRAGDFTFSGEAARDPAGSRPWSPPDERFGTGPLELVFAPKRAAAPVAEAPAEDGPEAEPPPDDQ